MERHADRSGSTTTRPAFELTVDRERARFGAWYEFFPRSTGTSRKHGTFKTAARRLRHIADMGFDVVYLPPIHPIGDTSRKGKNNTLDPAATDVGTIDDFDDFVDEAHRLGIEVALDFAIQCSPDHPWVKEHPEWFHHRPDGSIRYAENPPKKYQDIYPIDFDTPDIDGLFNALKDIVDF